MSKDNQPRVYFAGYWGYLNPRNTFGAFIWSLLSHVALFGVVNLIMALGPETPGPSDDYIDLGYEVFDVPPLPSESPQVVKRAVNPEPPKPQDSVTDSPKEMQDQESQVAGTQTEKEAQEFGGDSNGVAASTPYYRIKPKYPRAALVAGKEGWVLLSIDITEAGTVENVRVLDGEEKNLFQSEARRSVSLWKYRPFLNQEGKPYRVSNHQVKVSFRLDEASEGG